MTHNSIDLTGVPGFRADGPPAMHHRPVPWAWIVAPLIWLAVCVIVGLILCLPAIAGAL